MTEATIRAGIFVSVLIAMLAWEHVAAVRAVVAPVWRRRLANLALALIGTVVVRLAVPASLATVAYFAATHGIGLFNHLTVPGVVSWITTVVVLDLAVYLQHRAFHRWAIFWRLHAVHHADTTFDVTTGVRFHPVEIALSLVWKGAVVALLGAPAGAAVLFELVLSVTALITHGNVQLPVRVEQWVRVVFVTPSLHRIHHSRMPDERERNYGFSLSAWDRLFRTYRAAARVSDRDLQIGLAGVLPQGASSLSAMLLLPFRLGTSRR